MTSLLFRKDQNFFFDKQEEDFKEEIRIWYIVNVLISIIIIFVPALLASFLPEDRVNFQNLFLNGSFSFLGINVLFSMGTFLFNSLRLKDVKVERQIREIRVRLFIYFGILIILGAVFYVIQIAFNIKTFFQVSTAIIGSSLILYFSLGISRRIYLVKEELVGISFNEEINDDVKDLTRSTHDLD